MKRILVFLSVLFFSGLALSAQDPDEMFDVLDSAVVRDYRPRAENKTQSSMITISRKDFKFKSVLSSPDVIKTLQMLPGVTPGNEMSSTLNVRGGTGYDNLYLMDNVPIYQSGHFLGLFSVFNTDVVKSVDFYKGGFPARYGGRASSVVDVKLAEGNMKEHHSSFSLGVTDGRVQFEGPIKKDVLSYNVALRLGWVEAFLRPILNAVTIPDVSYSNDYTRGGNYAFADLNTKFTWRKDARNKVVFNAYIGHDFMAFSNLGTLDGILGGGTPGYKSSSFKDSHRWGNFLLSSIWENKLSDRRTMTLTAYLTDGYYNYINKTVKRYEVDNEAKDEIQKTKSFSMESNVSSVLDAGTKVHFVDKTISRHTLRYGGSLIWHHFTPMNITHAYTEIEGQGRAGEKYNEYGKRYDSPEFSLYAEDEMALSRAVHLNTGLRYMLFAVRKGVYNRLEPRIALSYVPSRKWSFKASYTEMNQPIHQVEAYHSEQPGSFWMPSTSRMKPIHALQGVLEAEWRPNHMWLLNVAGFYKGMRHLYEYAGSYSSLPSPSKWETQFVEGKGRSYGLEFYTEFQNERWELSSAYTLSWSQRYFDAFHSDWYRDRYDNRHNFVLNVIFKAHKLVDMYANWTFRSGNRYTLPAYEYGVSLEPNNFQMPAYHRLDVGIDFRAKTRKKGDDYTVSFGIYNLYGRRNPIYLQRDHDVYHRPTLKLTSVFPVLPSVRYTRWF